MDDPRSVLAASANYADESLLGGTPAKTAEKLQEQEPEVNGQGLVPCCVGVDMPGVGMVHAANCPAPHATLPAREPVLGEVPESLGRYLRDDLFCLLLFAARNLADANIVKDLRDDGAHLLGAPLSCRECHFGATSDGVLHHATSCNTGRVLDLVAELIAFPDSKSSKKEVAPAGGIARTDDGIRGRGLKERVCLKCGGHGGVWQIAEVPAATFDLSQLGINQLVGTAWRGVDVAIFTHDCERHQEASQGGAK